MTGRLFLILLVAVVPNDILGAILFEDHFDGSPLNGEWSVSERAASTPLGRTQTDFIPEVTNGTARFRFDTYNHHAPGALFRGTEIATRTKFAVSDGLTVQTRLRIDTPLPGGLVFGFFLFGRHGYDEQGGGTGTFDEIDFEVLSNLANASTPEVLLNAYDGNIDGTQETELGPFFIDVASLDFTEFNDFNIRWESDQVTWFINDQLVLTRTDVVGLADSNMGLHLNFWAPEAVFTHAYDGSLQPTANEDANQSFFVEIDSVAVSSIPEPEGYAFLAALFLVCRLGSIAISRVRSRASLH